MAQDIEEVRAAITAMFERIQQGNHYDILGVPHDVSPAQLTPSYRNLTKKWHVDRFSRYELGEDRAKVQKIFESINNAYRVLADAEARKAYDQELSGEAPDDEAAVIALLNADSLFLRGKSFLSQGSHKGAFDLLSEAHQLNPEDEDISAYLMYAEYLLIPKSDEGKPLKVTRAQAIYDELHAMSDRRKNEVDWLMVFVAVVGMGVGKERQSRALLREVTMLNPSNRDAQRQLRLLEMRLERQNKSGGFMDKLRGLLGAKK